MELGDISEKYESGGRGVKSISSGKSDPGGVSYGKHQLSTNAGTMHRFLRSPEGLPYAAKLGDLKPGTLAFNKAYLAVAAKDEAAFGKAQRDFITRTHYLPRAKVAGELGFRMKSEGVQEAIYSASVQHGGVEKIIDEGSFGYGGGGDVVVFEFRQHPIRNVRCHGFAGASWPHHDGVEIGEQSSLRGEKVDFPLKRGGDRVYACPLTPQLRGTRWRSVFHKSIYP